MQSLTLNALLVMGALFAVSLTGLTPASADEPLTDRDKLSGSWYATRTVHHGVEKPLRYPEKLIFTKDQMTFSSAGSTVDYSIDESTNPKRLKCNKGSAIYHLDGDQLTLCMPTPAAGKDPPYPTAVESTKESRTDLLELKRATLIPKDAPEQDFDKSLKQSIQDGIALLKEERTEEFIKRFAPSDELKQINEQGIEKAVKGFSPQREAVLEVFQVLPKLKPVFSTGTKVPLARFDLCQIHLPGGFARTGITFVKFDDHWCLMEMGGGITKLP